MYLFVVVQILVEFGFGLWVIVVVLLYDIVEDIGYVLIDLIVEFGDEVVMFVDGVMKFDKVKYGESVQVEMVCKMIVVMLKDICVLFIKLVDCLYNVCIWGFVLFEKVLKKVKEMLEIYVFLVNWFGIQVIKFELEDLLFVVLYFKIYNEIYSFIVQCILQCEKYLNQVVEEIDEDLCDFCICGKVVGCFKQFYLVYQKMVI